MNSYIQELINLYSLHSDIKYAESSKKYMRNQFDFLGIRAPIRRTLNKHFMEEHGLPLKAQLKDTILLLWNMPEREYQYVALDILRKTEKNLGPEDMPWLVSLLLKKSWWDTIDILSSRILGYLFLTYPELIPQYPEKWIKDDNFWLQRSAILYQLYYREKTDEDRLYRFILLRANSNEFFIQKAIGWVLRQYARTFPDRVKSFVLEHQLKPLSQREALKHID
jgi:3-methyladenine DNA glycosylase AlkD